ncbi:aminoglycoside phosphotransferase family protein [Catellatospora chokoriensis]|uniref:Aminoglycoside phosphotransferase n=1 Tax=Catellatospora chokoriensis TaxID=310353 RepID=A0A8J3NRY7_9ACTN|nr:aminoglycoside phosphotransferase family protein [Catellatospora chokoriensis]GIF90642.1 aminoglycoside phosphotransferase [Catellatospora chokoriensis]
MHPPTGAADDLTLDGGDLPDIDAVLAHACRQAGYDPAGAQLLRHFSNAVYLLPGGVVARVAYGPGAAERSTRAAAVAHWLARQGFPAAAPLPGPGSAAPSPVVVPVGGHDAAVTYWPYLPQPEQLRPPFEVLGKLAKLLHEVPGLPPVRLPRYRPLASLQTVLAQPGAARVLGDAALTWLSKRSAQVAATVDTVSSELGVGLVHGDMYSGNLLLAPAQGMQGWLLGDWDTVCVGPREADLAPTAVATRFGDDDATAAAVAAEYGHDVRTWAGYPVLREARELSTLSALVKLAGRSPDAAAELRLRTDSLMSGDLGVRWNRQ